MRDTVTQWQFVDEMAKPIHGFSRAGAFALFEYLTELESDENELEFDPVAFRCEFNEYENFQELQRDYNSIDSMAELHDRTQVIEFDEGIIIHAF